MKKDIIIGYNFLKPHTKSAEMLGLDDEHVIVDRKEYLTLITFFRDNPILDAWVGKGPIKYDRNTNEMREYNPNVNFWRKT